MYTKFNFRLFTKREKRRVRLISERPLLLFSHRKVDFSISTTLGKAAIMSSHFRAKLVCFTGQIKFSRVYVYLYINGFEKKKSTKNEF